MRNPTCGPKLINRDPSERDGSASTRCQDNITKGLQRDWAMLQFDPEEVKSHLRSLGRDFRTRNRQRNPNRRLSFSQYFLEGIFPDDLFIRLGHDFPPLGENSISS